MDTPAGFSCVPAGSRAVFAIFKVVWGVLDDSGLTGIILVPAGEGVIPAGLSNLVFPAGIGVGPAGIFCNFSVPAGADGGPARFCLSF